MPVGRAIPSANDDISTVFESFYNTESAEVALGIDGLVWPVVQAFALLQGQCSFRKHL